MGIKLPNEKTSGIVKLDKIKLLLYGPPKIGKTTLASGFPNTLFLATEKGYESHKIYKIDIESWIEFKEVVTLLTTKKCKYKTLVIDTVDLLFNQCENHICKKLKIIHLSDLSFGKAYEIVSKEFELVINKLFLKDYGLIFISHTKIVELISRTGKISKISPTLSNVARKVLIPKVSVIGYLDIKTIKTKQKKFVERRVLSFKPSEILEAGNRDGMLPDEIITYKDAQKTYQIFKQAYSKQEGG